METIYIDGSRGEGGGQILRTSLTLACVTGKHLRMENIRSARRKPGLAKQHLSCVHASRQICDGQCRGDAIGSQVLDFQPGPVRSGDYSFDIGSAGSASLVIQTILPALFLAGKPSTVTVTGGTHNPWAPPFDFLREAFIPAIATAGFRADCRLIKHGFFPAGGGKITFEIQPRHESEDTAIDLCESISEAQIHARIYTARLPEHIAHKQKTLLRQSKLNIEHIEHVEVTDSDGPGNCLMISLVNKRTVIFTAFGMRRKPSRDVVDEAVTLASDFLTSGAAVDRYLADQLLIYMALSKAGQYTTNELSTHLTTNIETIKKFLPVDFKTEQQDGGYRVFCVPV
ncbi:MAG: RNA 3'-terminal phosphate cyclase [Sedimentisphaerales bacterium]|nr:RNA 3'-terminal phosphate cyclase [Sedimentisphaerales bacterium]